MIQSMILHGILDSHNIANILDHTYLRTIATMVGAYWTNIRIANIMANRAIFHIMLQSGKRIGKSLNIFC